VSEAPAATLFDLPSRPGLPFGKGFRLLSDEHRRVVFKADTPIHIWDSDDKLAEATAIAILGRADVASHIDLAFAFGCHRNRVGRLVGRLEHQGQAALMPAKRGPKGPSKVTSEVLRVIAESSHLGHSATARLVTERTGVRLSPQRVCQLRQRSSPAKQPSLALAEPVPQQPRPATTIHAEVEIVPEAPIAPPTVEVLTALSEHEPSAMVELMPLAPATALPAEPLTEPTPPVPEPAVILPEQARGRYMGAALFYPALDTLGLLQAARSCFRLPNSERFGVRAVTLTLFFLALCGNTTVEAAKFLRRWELGALIGTGRAPVVKTLRRKLAEMVSQSRSAELGRLLARRWVEQAVIATAYLYIDGHMKVYSGKRSLAHLWNSQRRMPLPGFATYFVGDAKGRPLLFVTDEVGPSLTQAMPAIIAEIRQAVGGRRFTVIFDRGGYDSKLFDWLLAEGIDFITYQTGEPTLPLERFSRRRARFGGHRVYFAIAEDQVKINGSGPWRRIVVRTPDGHQTPIRTSLPARLPAAKIACLMFARWRQENLFRYMRQHYGLDQIISYALEEADGERMIPNPERRQLNDQIAALRRLLSDTRSDLGRIMLDEPHVSGPDLIALKAEREELMVLARGFDEQVAERLAERKTLPKHVPVASVGQRQQLKLEQKTIIDRIKLTAYNAEEWLLERLLPHYPNPHDARALLRSFALLSGEMRSTSTSLTITLDAPDNPLHRRALRGLCADLNQLSTPFPGTQLPLVYHVAVHHSEAAA
jgi:hypothetical protein